ncbi:MAG: hypothetical protein GY832_11645 [Chloroflexi bacterium]|nr:hypothetical protein [Chloroflexota bacterium]
MATNTFSRENLLTAARMTHNNEIINVAEVLNETNEIIQDAHVEQGNDITSHVVSRRTALPTVSWVKVGNGWSATTGLVQQARETMGQMKARYQCPQDVMKLQPNPSKYRSNQERAYIESMGQEFANTLFYGGIDPTSGDYAPVPEEFDGFGARLTSLSTTETTYVADNGDSGASDDTSIYFVQWGPGKVYLVYPRNSSQAGIQKEDKGMVFTTGDNSSNLWAYVTEFSWDVGLCVEDGRCIKRVANVSANSSDTYTLDEDVIIRARNNFKHTNGMIHMYCNETVFTQLQILAKDKSNVHWSENNPFGKKQLYFLDMPVRRCDAIRNDEASLT